MIKSVTVTNYLGDSLKLVLTRPDLSGFAVKKLEGLGPPKADVNTTSIVSADGSIFNMARLQNRNIVLSLEFVGTDIEAVRLKSYKYFPIKKPLTLSIETDNRMSEIQGYVESNEPDIFSKNETAQISIICPTPYFYSTGEHGTTETVFSGSEPLFEFPFENNSATEPLIEFGAIQNLTEQTVYYNGDADTGVMIKIHSIGEVSDLTIYNTGTRELMKIDTTKLATLTGYGIISGDDITINTVKGNKYISLLRNGITTNILNCLDKDADWFQLTKGDNIFTYSASSGGSNLQFRIESKIIYEGV